MGAFPPIVAFLLAVAGGENPSATDTLLTEVRSVGGFQHAFRLTVSPQGTIIIADVDRNHITLLPDQGTSGTSTGGYGWDASTFDRPTGLATDGLNLFVSDNGNHRIQRFDRTLSFISSFSTRDTSFAAARFGYPLGIALSRIGELYVLDGENLRVVKFTPALRYGGAFGDFDDQRARLRNPLKIVVAPNDHVYVLEPDRLLEFDMFGHYLRSIGSGMLAGVRSFALTRNGFILITDDHLQWFSYRGDPVRRLRSGEIATETPIDSLEDVSEVGDRLYLLTSTRLHVLRISIGED